MRELFKLRRKEVDYSDAASVPDVQKWPRKVVVLSCPRIEAGVVNDLGNGGGLDFRI